ncbi:MAG: lipoyl(octanoyl) transferase LipB [Pseudomonadota bacterium]
MTRFKHNNKCLYSDLGVVPLPGAERLMSAARDRRLSGDIPDLVLFMAHPPTIALGLRDRSEEHPRDLFVSPQKLKEEGIALVKSVRGGGITYHWPGQVVCYPVLLLKPEERDVPAHMNRLEEVGIRTLREYGVNVSRRRNSSAHVGLWIGNAKFASMGIRISRWVTTFGFVINLEGDHKPSAYIRPCGIDDAELETVEELLGHAPPRSRMMETIRKYFAEVLGRTLEPMPRSLVQEIRSPIDMSDAQMPEQDGRNEHK